MSAPPHGFTVQATGNADIDRLQQRIKAALDLLASKSNVAQLTDNTRWVTVGGQNLQDQTRGPDVTGTSTVLPAPAGYQDLLNSTTYNFISTVPVAGKLWYDGARIEYYLLAGSTFAHHAVGGSRTTFLPMHLLAGANTPVAAGRVIVFRLDLKLGFWIQVQ